MPRVYTSISRMVRFRRYVDVDGPVHPKYGQCWVWTGSRGGPNLAYGYHDNIRVHRLAWEEIYGEIPGELCVLHRCDNSLCVNPRHLFLGSQQDNMDDMANKGRRAAGDLVASKGEKNPKAKLDESRVREIRKLQGKMGCRRVAAAYGVEKTVILRIWKRLLWRHLP